MFTEFEVWNLFQLARLANAAWMAGLSFLIWVTFRAANMVGESGNTFSKAVEIILPISSLPPAAIVAIFLISSIPLQGLAFFFYFFN